MAGAKNITSKGAQKYYYERDPILNSDGQQQNTSWHGYLCESFGLKEGDKILSKDFQLFCEGKSLDEDRIIKTTYADQETNRTEHRAGLDLVLSDPKSVSHARLVLDDRRIDDVRNKAYEAFINELQDRIYYRETTEGITKSVKAISGGLIARFQHSTSRENDPQSHDHNIILNIVERNDGNGYRALDNSRIIADQRYLDAIYKSEEAYGLKQLGYGIVNHGNGKFEIEGYPQEVLDQFSKRHQHIKETEQALKDAGTLPYANDHQINNIATLESRPAKDTSISKEELKDSWLSQHAEIGISPETIKQNIERTGHDVSKKEEVSAIDCVSMAVADLTARESCFTRTDALREGLYLGMGALRDKDVKQAFNELIKAGTIQSLDFGKQIYSSKEMIAIENNIQKVFQTSDQQFKKVMSIPEAEKYLERYERKNKIDLTAGQKEYFYASIGGSGNLIVQGDAGTGKTTAIKAINEACKEKDITIIGIAKTGKATAKLAESVDTAMTIDKFLIQYSDKSTNPQAKRMKLIVDESSMTGSRETLKILKIAQRDGLQIDLVGDRFQLMSLSAGKPFNELQDRSGVKIVHLDENIRAKTAYAREIFKHAASQDIPKAVEIIEQAGKLYEIKDRAERLEAIKNNACAKDNTIILTSINVDRNELNEMIHQEKVAQGILKNEQTITVREPINVTDSSKRFAYNYKTNDYIFASKPLPQMNSGAEAKIVQIDSARNIIYGRIENKNKQDQPENIISIDTKLYGDRLSVYQEKAVAFAEGEQIILNKRDKVLSDDGKSFTEVKNGYAGTINSIEHDGRIHATLEGDKKVIIDPQNNKYFDRGWAVTVYKSQGESRHNVIINGSGERTNRNEFYVAGSRSITDLHLYVDDKNQYIERSKIEQEKSSTFDHHDKHLSLNTDGRIDITDLIFDRSSSKADRESDREINQKNEVIIEMKDQSANNYGRMDITDLIFDRSSSKADRESDREINQKDEFIIKTKDQSPERLLVPSASMEIEI
jgi:conjugative relaxase-like TrwC/TraI family protein